MVRTVATVGFIAGVAVVAVVMWHKPTTLRGSVIAADLLEHLAPQGVTRIECDDAPITNQGVTFQCRLEAKDGSRATIEYVKGRDGAIVPRRLGGGTRP